MIGIILAAGKCSRMEELCIDLPKAMLPLGNQPILKYIIDRMRPCVDEIYIVVDYQHQKIIDYFGETVKYIKVQNTLGSAESVYEAISKIDGDEFAITYCDIIMSGEDYEHVIKNKGIAITSVLDCSIGSAVYFDQKHRITELVEKPKPNTSKSNWNSAGLLVVRKNMFSRDSWFEFRHLEQCFEMSELNLTRYIQYLIKLHQYSFHAIPISQWYDMGTKADYLQWKKVFI